MRPLISLLLAGVMLAGAKAQVTSHRNPVLTHPVEGEVSGIYANDGTAKTRVRILNNTRAGVKCFVRFPEESNWRATVTLEPGPKVDATVKGLPPGVYEFAAQRTITDTPSFWDWGPVSLKVTRKSRWTLK